MTKQTKYKKRKCKQLKRNLLSNTGNNIDIIFLKLLLSIKLIIKEINKGTKIIKILLLNLIKIKLIKPKSKFKNKVLTLIFK
jgi:hypothetical protein